MAQQPEPPRRILLSDVLGYTVVLPAERRRVRSGLIVLAGVGLLLIAVDWGPIRALLAVIGLPVAIALISGPLRLAFRLAWAARHGTVASAVVSDTVDATEVVCAVLGPRGAFRAVVGLDGLPEPQPAERVLVVVHPADDEVLWCIGPAGG